MHVCLNCMVVTGNPRKYESLRTSYNSVADTGAPRAPPFEEFRGMSSICGNIFCRWVLPCCGRLPSCRCEYDEMDLAGLRRATRGRHVASQTWQGCVMLHDLALSRGVLVYVLGIMAIVVFGDRRPSLFGSLFTFS